MKITSKKQLHKVVTEMVEDSFNDLFVKIYELAKATSGDIDPGAAFKLEEMQAQFVRVLKERFAGLTTKTVWWNMSEGQQDYQKAMKELDKQLKRLQ